MPLRRSTACGSWRGVDQDVDRRSRAGLAAQEGRVDLIVVRHDHVADLAQASIEPRGLAPTAASAPLISVAACCSSWLLELVAHPFGDAAGHVPLVQEKNSSEWSWSTPSTPSVVEQAEVARRSEAQLFREPHAGPVALDKTFLGASSTDMPSIAVEIDGDAGSTWCRWLRDASQGGLLLERAGRARGWRCADRRIRGSAHEPQLELALTHQLLDQVAMVVLPR